MQLALASDEQSTFMFSIMCVNQDLPRPTPRHLSQRREMPAHAKICTQMFMTALFAMAPNSPDVFPQVSG